MIVTSPAIVLHSRKQGETSKILTVYTKNYGKINVMAKGAREIRSKFGGALEAFSISEIVFYYKKDKGGLYLLSKADTAHSNAGILKSLERIQAATQVAELALRTIHDEEENTKLFDLLSDVFTALGSTPDEHIGAIIAYFFLNYAELSGFMMNLRNPEDSSKGAQYFFRPRTGEFIEIVPDHHRAEHDESPQADLLRVLPESYSALKYLDSADIAKACDLDLSREAVKNLFLLFSAFFPTHFQGFERKPLSSADPYSN